MGCNYRLHGRLGYKVSRLARLMEARLEEKISRYGVSRLMWCVLSGVGMEGVHTPSELASYVGVARSAVSRALRSMEKMELINRRPATGDGRGIEITLTDKGRDIMEQCHIHVEWLNDHFTSKIADPDLEALMRNIDVLSSGETRELDRL